MNVAAYCRVSTDKSDQLNSLASQKRFFDEYTCKNGHTLVRLYADEGISGTRIKNRKEFLQLMRDARQGAFDMVVVKDISRFARNTVDLLNSTRQLRLLNIETLFLTSNMTVLGNSEFVLTIFGALAQEESANTSKRVKFGKKMNAEKGRVPNIVYGYDKTPGDYFNLTVNEFEAEVIRRIYDLYVNHNYGAAKIAQSLNESGLKTKRDCDWSQTAVSRILTNALYTGKIINGKQEIEDFLTGVRREKAEAEWIINERSDLRIIDPAIFEQAQNILSERSVKYKINRERHSDKHLFSTLIKCADCGHSFRRTERTYKNTYVRWICGGRNANGTGACGNKTTIGEDELSGSLQNYFIAMLKQKNDLIKHVTREMMRVQKAGVNGDIYVKELKKTLAKNQKARQKVMDMYSDELINRDEFKEKMTVLNAEVGRLENELRQIVYGNSYEDILQQAFQSAEDIVSVDMFTNSQLKRLVREITVDSCGHVDIYLRLCEANENETFLETCT